PELFCELLIHKSIDAFHQAKIIQSAQKDVIFFDRCILEGINYFKNLGIDKYDHLIGELRYYPTIFMAPPWKEIYHNDEERQHSFESALNEYEQISKFYPNCGYQIIKLPKVNVKERVKFMISILAG
ncbi:MAG: AAA family ATPase, partial [Legionella sp.]|nr:AAA family ATPase [Legionella sp.]